MAAFQGSPSRGRRGNGFIHWLLSPPGQSLLQGQTYTFSFHKPRSGQLPISDLVSSSHLRSNRQVLDGRQEGNDVPMCDMNSRVVSSVVVPGSSAVGAAQAMLDLLSPAAHKWADLSDG